MLPVYMLLIWNTFSDTQYNVTVKHGWKLHETHKDKWYLLYTKTETGKDRWLKALADERKRVREDQENGTLLY